LHSGGCPAGNHPAASLDRVALVANGPQQSGQGGVSGTDRAARVNRWRGDDQYLSIHVQHQSLRSARQGYQLNPIRLEVAGSGAVLSVVVQGTSQELSRFLCVGLDGEGLCCQPFPKGGATGIQEGAHTAFLHLPNQSGIKVGWCARRQAATKGPRITRAGHYLDLILQSNQVLRAESRSRFVDLGIQAGGFVVQGDVSARFAVCSQ